jgi:hypothetical protein
MSLLERNHALVDADLAVSVVTPACPTVLAPLRSPSPAQVDPAEEENGPHAHSAAATVDEEPMEAELACTVCDGIDSKAGNDILLCDGCDLGFHMLCLPRPLAKVPEGEWKCHRCEPRFTRENEHAMGICTGTKLWAKDKKGLWGKARVLRTQPSSSPSSSADAAQESVNSGVSRVSVSGGGLRVGCSVRITKAGPHLGMLGRVAQRRGKCWFVHTAASKLSLKAADLELSEGGEEMAQAVKREEGAVAASAASAAASSDCAACNGKHVKHTCPRGGSKATAKAARPSNTGTKNGGSEGEGEAKSTGTGGKSPCEGAGEGVAGGNGEGGCVARCLISFQGYSSKYDEWIEIGVGNLRPWDLGPPTKEEFGADYYVMDEVLDCRKKNGRCGRPDPRLPASPPPRLPASLLALQPSPRPSLPNSALTPCPCPLWPRACRPTPPC